MSRVQIDDRTVDTWKFHGFGEACIQVSDGTSSLHAIQHLSQDSLTFVTNAEQDCPIRTNPESTEPSTDMGSAAQAPMQKEK
ncbi:hypothetical protein GB937_001619 [Aspergillus fischeri]|nr:hypothetical protein GB937_001619 [Aspergillus fischeri]